METVDSRHNSNADTAAETFGLRALAYDLPEGLIAQEALTPRDASRLLIVDRSHASLEDGSVRDIVDILKKGDLLVLNDTKVVPARFAANRKTGGRVGGLFEREIKRGEWQVLLEGSRRLRAEEILTVQAGASDTISMRLNELLGDGLKSPSGYSIASVPRRCHPTLGGMVTRPPPQRPTIVSGTRPFTPGNPVPSRHRRPGCT